MSEEAPKLRMSLGLGADERTVSVVYDPVLHAGLRQIGETLMIELFKARERQERVAKVKA